MLQLKEFNNQLLTKGSEHVLNINNINYRLKVNKMLLLCQWTDTDSQHHDQKMFSNTNTVDDVVGYITSVTNQLLPTGSKPMHTRLVLDKLTNLLPERA